MDRKTTITLLTLGLGCLWTAPAHAAVNFDFTTDQPLYSVPPASKVPVLVYLRETLVGSDSSILAAEGGLFAAGLKIVPQSPLPSQPATLPSLDDIAPNAEFSGGSLANQTPLTLLLADGILAEPGPAGDIAADSSRRVLLATFYFTTGSILGETTLFTITDYDDFGISSDTLTWQGSDLDRSIAPGQFAITIIPEPSAGLALAVLGLAGCLSRRRLRQRYSHPRSSQTQAACAWL